MARRANIKGEATRLKLLNVATEAFADAGFEGTSLRQVAAAASIDLSTLKYHFGDKKGLFAAVYHRGHQAFVETLGPAIASLATSSDAETFRKRLPNFVSVLTAHMASDIGFVRIMLFRLLEQGGEVDDEARLRAQAIDLVDGALRMLVSGGVIRPIDTRSLGLMLIAGLSAFYVGTSSWPSLLNDDADSARGVSFDQRRELFFQELLERHLGVV